MAPPHNQTANILPLHRGVRPIPVEHYERIFRMPAHAEQDRIQQQLRDYGDMPAGVAIAERMVEFFRERAGRIGVALYVTGVAAACYFAWQFAR